MGTGEASQIKRGPGRPPSIQQSAQAPDKPEDPNWVTPDEAELYERMLFKPYVRRSELKKGDNDKFFYQIVSLCPYVPAGIMSQTHQHLVQFEIQKFHRDQTITRNVFDDNRKAPREVTSNAEVKWVEIDQKTGNSRVIDADASFTIDSREFDKVFVRDDK